METSQLLESAVPAADDPNMQTVIVPGKRMSAQEQEDYDKYAMRMSMLQASTASRSNRSSGRASAPRSYPSLLADEVKLMNRVLNGTPGASGNGNVAPALRSKLSSGLSPSPFGRDPSYGPVDVRGGPDSLRSIYSTPAEVVSNWLQPGENIKGNVFFGGAGMDGPYIKDMVRAFDKNGIALTPANSDTWSNGTLPDAVLGVQAYRYGQHPFPTMLDKFQQSGTQFNLIGYSYGSEVAAQVAVNYARGGTTVDNLVLIGSPISEDYLKAVQNTKNINNVIIINLRDKGDPIYAGMANSTLVGAAPTLAKQMLGGNGQGHFYYAPDSSAGAQRRNDLAAYLYKQGVR